MQSCLCASLPSVAVAADLLTSPVAPSFTAAGTTFSRVVRCPSCLQWWRIDAFGDERERFAEKFDPPPGGIVLSDPEEKQRECLIRTFGGQTTQFCYWGRCTNYRLYDCLYCVDHLLLMTGER